MDALLKPTVIAIPFFLVTFTLEWWAVKAGRAKGRYETKDAHHLDAAWVWGAFVVDTLLASDRPLHPDAVLALPPVRCAGDVVELPDRLRRLRPHLLLEAPLRACHPLLVGGASHAPLLAPLQPHHRSASALVRADDRADHHDARRWSCSASIRPSSRSRRA